MNHHLWSMIPALVALSLALGTLGQATHLAHYDPSASSSAFGEPVFRLEPPAVINFANTKGATIPCLVSGSPRPTVTWYTSSNIDMGHQSLLSGSSDELAMQQTRLVTNVTKLRQIVQNGAALRLFPFKEADFRQDIHSAEYRCVASNHLATIHSRSVLVQAVMSASSADGAAEQQPGAGNRLQAFEAKVNDEFVALQTLAVLRCRPSAAASLEFSHLIEWFASDGLQVAAGETSKGSKFTAFKSGELHVNNVEKSDLQRTYGCRLRNSISQEIVSSSGLAHLVATDLLADSAGGAKAAAAEPSESSSQYAAAADQVPQVLHSLGQLIGADALLQLRETHTALGSLLSGASGGPALSQAAGQAARRPLLTDSGQLFDQATGEPAAAKSSSTPDHWSSLASDWRLLVPCALRLAPGSQTQVRWFYQAPAVPSGTQQQRPMQEPVPLEHWAAVNSIQLTHLISQTGLNSAAAAASATQQQHFNTTTSMAGQSQISAGRPSRPLGKGGHAHQLPATRFVVGPTYLAIEWPSAAQSGRYVGQVGGKSVCDTNVIVRQPIKARIEPRLAATGSAGQFPAALQFEAAASSSGGESLMDNKEQRSLLSRALGWLAEGLAPSLGKGARESGDYDDEPRISDQRRRTVRRQRATVATGARARTQRAHWAQADQSRGKRRANPVLDDDARRLQVRGAASIEPPPLVRVGQRLQLHCHGSGYPIEAVKWFRNGRAINTQSSSDFQVEIVSGLQQHHQRPQWAGGQGEGASNEPDSGPDERDEDEDGGQDEGAESWPAGGSSSGGRSDAWQLLSTLIIRQVQPRDVGLSMFECFAENSFGDRARAGLAVFVAEPELLEWARSVCPIQVNQASGSLRAAAHGLGTTNSADSSDSGGEEELEEESTDWSTGSSGSSSADLLDSMPNDDLPPATFAGWAGPRARESRRAGAIMRRHNPWLRALLLESEPAELLCPALGATTTPTHLRRGVSGAGNLTNPARVQWRRWSPRQTSEPEQQPSLAEAPVAGALGQVSRNFNHLFSGDSRFVINGSSLQIRSPSKRQDEALYACQQQWPSNGDGAEQQQTSPGNFMASEVSGGGSDSLNEPPTAWRAAPIYPNGGGGSQKQQQAVHQSSLASSAHSCSRLLAATLFELRPGAHEMAPIVPPAGKQPPQPQQPASYSYMSSISIRIVAKPRIDPFEFSRNLEEGMRAVAVCAVVSGQSPVDLTWFKDGQLLTDDELGSVSVDQANGFSSALTFHRIRPAHSGLYTCVAANAFASTNHTSRLIVNVAPYFIEPPKSTQAVLGSQVLVNCRAGGQPRWRKLVPIGGAGVGSSANRLLAPSGGLAGNLESQLDFQTGQQMAPLAPLTNPNGVSLSPVAPIMPSASSSSGSSKFEFRVITSNSHIQILENGSMIIKEVELSDSSRYVCQAFNGINPTLSEVIDLQVLSPAKFEVNYETISVKRDSMIKFNCAPRGDQPMRIEWRKESNLLVPAKSGALISGDQNVTLPEGLAATGSGSKYSEIAYFVSNKNTSTTNSEQQSLRSRHSPLLVRPQQLLAPTESNEQQQAYDGMRSSELFINYADRSDTGTFVCMAKNDYGKDELTYRLVVQEVPDPPLNVNVQSVQANSLKLAWSAPFDGNLAISHYVIEYRKLNNQAMSSIGSGANKQDLPAPSGGSEWMRLLVSTNKLEGANEFSASQFSINTLNGHLPQQQQQQQQSQSQQPGSAYNLVLRQLSAKSTYQLRVAAANAIGQGAFSSHLTAITAEEPPNGRASDLRCQPLSSSSLKVLWRGPAIIDEQAPIKGYYVSHRKFAGAYLNQIAPNSGALMSRAHGGEQSAELANTNSNSQQQQQPWLATVSISASNTSYATILPGGGGEGSDSSNLIGLSLLSRASPDGAAAGPTATPNFPLGGATGLPQGANYEFTLNQLEKHTKYEIRVQPYNSMGVGVASDTVGQTLKFDRPGQPTLKLVAARRQSLELKWSISEEQPLMGFSLFYKCEYDDWQEIQLGLIYRYLIENLRCGNKYQIYLSAFNTAGRSDPSDVLSARTEGTAPVAPEKGQFFLHSNITEVVLDMAGWQSGGCPISSFMIQFKRLHESNWFILSEGSTPFTNSDKITIPDLAPGTWYKLLVTALNEAGSTNAEYLFSTLTVNGEQIAPPNFALDAANSGHHHHHQASSTGWLGTGSGPGGRSMWLTTLGQLLSLSSPGSNSEPGGSGGGQLLLPVSCIVLILVATLATYLYYNHRALGTGRNSTSSHSSSTAALGGATGAHLQTNSNCAPDHHHHHHHPAYFGAKSQAGPHSHSHSHLHLANSSNHHHQLVAPNGDRASGSPPSATLMAHLAASGYASGESTSPGTFVTGDEKQLIQQQAQNGHHLLHQHLIGAATTLPLDGSGASNCSGGNGHQQQSLAGSGSGGAGMLDSLIGATGLQSFVGASARSLAQKSQHGMRLLSSGNIFAGPTAPPGSNCTSSSHSTHSTNCFEGSTSSSSATSGGGGAKAKLQLIDESSMMQAGGVREESLEEQQQQADSRCLYGIPGTSSPARSSTYSHAFKATTNHQAPHVDVLEFGGESSQQQQQVNNQLVEGANLASLFGDEQQEQVSRTYGLHNQRLNLSSSFASAAELAQRSQQPQEQQQFYYQPPQQVADEEPIYQRLDKFQAYGLGALSKHQQQFAALSQASKAQTLRFNPTHFSLDDSSAASSAAAAKSMTLHRQPAFHLDQQQHFNLDGSFYLMSGLGQQQQQSQPGCHELHLAGQYEASNSETPTTSAHIMCGNQQQQLQ